MFSPDSASAPTPYINFATGYQHCIRVSAVRVGAKPALIHTGDHTNAGHLSHNVFDNPESASLGQKTLFQQTCTGSSPYFLKHNPYWVPSGCPSSRKKPLASAGLATDDSAWCQRHTRHPVSLKRVFPRLYWMYEKDSDGFKCAPKSAGCHCRPRPGKYYSSAWFLRPR